MDKTPKIIELMGREDKKRTKKAHKVITSAFKSSERNSHEEKQDVRTEGNR